MNKKSCERCQKETIITTMSWLNLDILCLDCKEKEKSHPKYDEAKKVENEYVKNGNFNYKGLLFDQKI